MLLIYLLNSDFRQTKKVLPPPYPDDHADTGGKTYDDRVRNIFDDHAHAGQAEQQQHAAGHHCRDLQTGYAVLGSNTGEDDNKCTGRTGDLQTATTETGNDDPGDDVRQLMLAA